MNNSRNRFLPSQFNVILLVIKFVNDIAFITLEQFFTDMCVFSSCNYHSVLTSISPPIVSWPQPEKTFTASSEESTMTWSVRSAPTWKPQLTPTEAMAEGPDHSPDGRRAITVMNYHSIEW